MLIDLIIDALSVAQSSVWSEKIAEALAAARQLRSELENRKWIGLTSEDWENTPDTGKQGCERDAELFDWIEQTLKDKNDV